jgi:hypothetical protein
MKLRRARKIEKRARSCGGMLAQPYRMATLDAAERQLRRAWARRNPPRSNGYRLTDDDWFRANRLESILQRIHYFPRRGGRRVYVPDATRRWRQPRERDLAGEHQAGEMDSEAGR